MKEGTMKKLFSFPMILIFLILGVSAPMIAWGQEKPLVIGFEGDAATLDPHGRNETTTTTVQRHVYENLVGFDADLKIQPELAESWKLIDDHTWEFKLRKGVKFHNGEPLNAAAVQYSLERCKTHRKASTSTWFPITKRSRS